MHIQLSEHRIQTYAPLPIAPSHGKGPWLYDTQGHRYLDFASGIAVNALGHCHPAVVSAIDKQSKRLLHTSNLLAHPGYDTMCQRLAIISGLDQAFLCNSGTEATEAALKLIRRTFAQQPRTKIITTEGSFHGRSLGALSITGQRHYREGFDPLFADVVFVPFGDLDALQQQLDANTAAVFIEPVQGNGGLHVASAEYLRAIKEQCQSHGALLVLDEIQTGIGRTGEWYAFQHHSDWLPDILLTAKALGGGLPLGAMLTHAHLASAFSVGSHGSTFGGNPLACATGLATLDVIEHEGLRRNATDMGRKFRQHIAALNHPIITEVRGLGLMLGIEVAISAKSLRNALLNEGVIVTTAGADKVLRVLPPLNIGEAEIEYFITRLNRALTTLNK